MFSVKANSPIESHAKLCNMSLTIWLEAEFSYNLIQGRDLPQYSRWIFPYGFKWALSCRLENQRVKIIFHRTCLSPYTMPLCVRFFFAWKDRRGSRKDQVIAIRSRVAIFKTIHCFERGWMKGIKSRCDLGGDKSVLQHQSVHMGFQGSFTGPHKVSVLLANWIKHQVVSEVSTLKDVP